MELVLRYRGFEVWRTAAGHLVVVDPEDTEEERAELVALLASSGALDALFFPGVPEALGTIDGLIERGLARRTGSLTEFAGRASIRGASEEPAR